MVSSGTGENAQTGEPTWGKTGTTDDNGDAWFCGATEEITACVWVGHADTVEPMKTEFGGQPVDGGTFPALIFADVVNAYDDARGGAQGRRGPRGRGQCRRSPSETTPPTTATETGGQAERQPASPTPSRRAPEARDAGASGATGGPVAPTGGGVARAAEPRSGGERQRP